MARAEFDDRTRVLKVDIAELNEQLFETMSAGELAVCCTYSRLRTLPRFSESRYRVGGSDGAIMTPT